MTRADQLAINKKLADLWYSQYESQHLAKQNIEIMKGLRKCTTGK